MFLVLAVAMSSMINDLIGDDLIDFDLILLIDLNPFKQKSKKEREVERERERTWRERERAPTLTRTHTCVACTTPNARKAHDARNAKHTKHALKAC